MRSFTTFEPSAVEWAAFSAVTPRFGGRKNHGRSPAQREGLRYEARAQDYLLQLYPDTYVPSPWLTFRLRHEPMPRWCQPDGIIVDMETGRLIIIEIKLRHMAEAYTQVIGIYQPVLKKIFPGWEMRHVEMVRWYDAGSYFPVPVQLISNIDLAPRGRFGVHIWKPS